MLKPTYYGLESVGSGQDLKKVQLWGALDTSDLDGLEEVFNEFTSVTGQVIVGRNVKYRDNKVSLDGIEPKTGETMKMGEIFVNRTGAGLVVLRGIMPAKETDINSICEELINGSNTIGGFDIEEVKPQISVGKVYSK